jgi:succinyl-CoA synthetase alpha subunit
MIEYGTNIVAGVTPGRGGETVYGVKVFDTVKEAVSETDANTSVAYVPESAILDAIIECIEAGTHLIVCLAEYVPLHDILIAKQLLQNSTCKLVGPNCNGICTPGEAKIGFFPKELSLAGRLGVVSRSGTLSYGVLLELRRAGIGQSTVVGIGGSPVKGISFVDCLEMFEADPDTDAVLLIGEIGGTDEEKAAEYLKLQKHKPVVAHIVGHSVPRETAMGHAGAIITRGKGTYESKTRALESANVPIARSVEDIPQILKSLCPNLVTAP